MKTLTFLILCLSASVVVNAQSSATTGAQQKTNQLQTQTQQPNQLSSTNGNLKITEGTPAAQPAKGSNGASKSTKSNGKTQAKVSESSSENNQNQTLPLLK